MKKIFAFIFICQLGFAQTKQTLQTFEGQINGKIAITLALVLEDNLVYGTLRYKVVGEAIKVIGSVENNKVLLHEFDSKGNVTGVYFGTKKGDVIAGSWTSPSGKEMSFSVKKTAIAPIDKVENKTITGTYAYAFGKEGGSGNIYVRQIDATKAIVEMQAVKGGPSYNQATVEKTTLKLMNNQAVYENKEFGKCKLKMSFFEGGLSIIYLDEAYECGFGNGASVSGNYLKIDGKAPKFDQK